MWISEEKITELRNIAFLNQIANTFILICHIKNKQVIITIFVPIFIDLVRGYPYKLRLQ